MVKGVRPGIAAKRIKSEVQTKKRIPKAAKQIQISSMPGIITLDRSVALNPSNERITIPIPDKEFAHLHREAINHFLRHYNERIREWVRGRGVIGIIVHDHQVRFKTDASWWLSSMTTRFCSTEDSEGKEHFGIFELPYVNALPNMQHL
jgi:hypothetical protein